MRQVRTFCLTALACVSFTLAAAAAEFAKEPLSEIKGAVDQKKATLVDVREKEEWDGGHVKGAISLPLSGLEDGVTNEKLKPLPKGKILYLHCAKGGRAMAAAKILEKRGFEVRPIQANYQKLVAAGFLKAEK